jgi:ferric-dicitrate binding protein FerR (iron transport regulator)
MAPVDSRIPPSRRLRGDILLAIVVGLLVLAVAWWWAFAGEGRQRFRSAEPTLAPAEAPPS